MSVRDLLKRRRSLARVGAYALSALMTVSLGPAGVVQASGGAASDLAVASDPGAAAVYIDGQPRGATPLRVSGLAPGDHRVRVVKDGYLENSRVVRVANGRLSSVTVGLTPDARAGGIRRQVEPQEEVIVQKGSGKKWLLIGVGVVAVGAGAFLLLSGKNHPPVAAGSVSPTAAGMAKLTSFSFNGGASSDPDGDPLTYSWEFGDGQSGSGQATTHVYSTPGSYAVSLTISDGKASASAAVGSVSVVDNLSGTWTGTHSSFTNTHTFTITQSAPSFSGTWQVSGGFSPGTVSGQVDAANNFVCPCNVTFTATAPCPLAATFTGQLSPDGRTLSGNGSVTYGACATRQGTFSGAWTLRR